VASRASFECGWAIVFFVGFLTAPFVLGAQTTAMRAGRLIDPATGKAEANQVILVEGEKIQAIGPSRALPAGAEVIDPSRSEAPMRGQGKTERTLPDSVSWRLQMPP